MAPSVTESLFALGAGDRVVGVTDFCDYPAAARTKARIGGMINPNWETILSLKADLLIATTAGNDRDVLARTESLHLPVFFLHTPDIDSLLRSFELLGTLLGSSAEATALRKDLAKRLQKLDTRASAGPHPTVLFLVWGDPIVVPGRGTFLDDALRRSGCNSITSEGPPGWPTYDLETILARDPGWILATEQNAAFLKSLKERPGWRNLEAVLRGRTATVSPALERPAPRVVQAMEQLRELVEKDQDEGPRGDNPARPRGDHPPPLPSVIRGGGGEGIPSLPWCEVFDAGGGPSIEESCSRYPYAAAAWEPSFIRKP
jgi:iron complex transport system substrate-binding protein